MLPTDVPPIIMHLTMDIIIPPLLLLPPLLHYNMGIVHIIIPPALLLPSVL